MAAVDLIIFGASGDLSARKLFPALLQLERLNLLDADLRIAAVARKEQSLDDFLPLLKQKMSSYMGSDAPSDKEWERFTSRFSYVTVNFSEPDQYGELREWLDDERTSLFYFATPPSLFAPICEHLSTTNCLAGDCRIVVEKPIGENLESSVKVNETLAKYFDEKSIYRIDHYLGKETVQNLLVLRFANSFINSQWDNTCIDHVQITVGEMVGIEGRWTYYDKVGQLRDMVQNHLLQLVCLVAMEPPAFFDADQVRDEKLRVLRAIRPVLLDEVVCGQYQEYETELGRPSNTETYVAMKLAIENWRWAGVPFYIRTGKQLGRRASEIVITFKQRPHDIFRRNGNGAIDSQPNRLIIRLQPSEGLCLQLISKQPGPGGMRLFPSELNLSFDDTFNERLPDAYERLLMDTARGNQTLFMRRDEVFAAWDIIDPILEQLAGRRPELYRTGSMGPADRLLEADGRQWIDPYDD